MEEWRQVEGFESYYVSNMGRVYNTLTKRFIGNKNSDKYGYKRVKLSKLGARKPIDVHRLVAETFIPNPLNLKCVNHKDGNKENNTVDNLEWCTYSDNNKHAIKMGLTNHPKGEDIKISKLKESDIRFIRENYKPNSKEYNYRKLAQRFGVSKRTIYNCVKGIIWKDLEQ